MCGISPLKSHEKGGDGWMAGWMDGWMDGWGLRRKDLMENTICET